MLTSPIEPAIPPTSTGRWTKELTRYHWFVLLVAALGWLFDTMDQQLFTLSRNSAMVELLGKDAAPGDAGFYGGVVTMIFMLGWATGGMFFGVLGDRIGRAKTMALTILAYSIFTGLSALSRGIWDFAAYRFLTGLGVGGEFAVGVALVAEAMPDRARPFALGLLQALSAVGNVTAGVIGYLLLGGALTEHLPDSLQLVTPWRLMFVVGAAPALLVVLIQLKLKEPDRWKSMAPGQSKRAGSYSELLGDPRWRRNALVGLCLAASGVVGLWGIGFFMPELIKAAIKTKLEADGLAGDVLNQTIGRYQSYAMILQNIGAFFGMYAFTMVTAKIGRKMTFAIFFVLALLSTAGVFYFFNSFSDLWMVPIMGFCQLALFGGYAIYFPELFPTRLRSTGTSFCYNVGRYVAALGPYFFGVLTSKVYVNAGGSWPTRYAGITMCTVFLIGLIALPFAPETKGKPLPE